jgi:biotin synthase
LNDAVNIFGEGKVSTHLIVGLGETDSEIVQVIQKCVEIGVLPALFAFTPVFGTGLEGGSQPPIERYRRIQVARSLILHKATTFEKICFGKDGQLLDFGVSKQVLRRIAQSDEPFVTSGCPDCNRPYYNEKPSGPIYNFPRELAEEEICEIREQLGLNGA